jgi:serine phosphatase RsbU (regulator of sigma subunit)
MPAKPQIITQEYQAQAEQAASQGDWKAAAKFYAQCVEQRLSELALINSVQEGLSSRLAMQNIYDLVGDKLRDTFNAQVVMISQYDPNTQKIFHHYAIERGQHLHFQGWQPVDSSRREIIRTRKPFMINMAVILDVVSEGKMWVLPGTEMPKTWLGVPMLVGDEAVGVVSLQNLDKENAFTKTDIDLLMTLTNSLSLSLENARLFSETQRLLKLLEGEMLLARQTQRSILPRRLPRRRGYDFGSLVMPARAVGGDFFDLIHLDKDRLSLVIGDVSDKGLPAALVMALTFSLLRLEAERSDDPPQILRNANRHLMRLNDAGMFVTLLYGILDCRTGAFKYARAGHLPPLLIDQVGEALEVRMDEGQPLGILEEVKLDVQEVVIPPGGLAMLFSDGLNEATDSQGVQFGLPRLQQILAANRLENAKTICTRLWQAVNAHSGEQPHQDDFVTVVVKRHGSHEQPQTAG